MKIQFKCGYNMACTYTVEKDEYIVRNGCHVDLVRADYLPRLIKACGTVMRSDSGALHKYPPRDVVAELGKTHGYTLVGARWSEDFSTVEYDGETPPSPEYRGSGTYLDPRWYAYCEAFNAACRARSAQG